MRILRAVLGSTLLATPATPLFAQTSEVARDRMAFDVAAGMSRYGPHAFGGLEVAMKRWLAVRGEGLFTFQTRESWPDYRFASVALAGVLSLPSDSRVTPYLLGGYTLSVSQGWQPGPGPLGALGIRVRVGGVQPFMEIRAQHRIGAPMSIGIRF